MRIGAFNIVSRRISVDTRFSLLRKQHFFYFFLVFVSASLSFAQEQFRLHFPDTPISSITVCEKSIFVSTYGKGVQEYNPLKDTWVSYSSASTGAPTDFFYCAAVSKDFIWAGGSDGLYIYNRSKKTWVKHKFSLGGEYGNWIRGLFFDTKKNILWLARFQNISSLDVKTNTFHDYDLTRNKDAKTNTFSVVRAEGNGILWFGSEAGAFRYDSSKDLNDKNAVQFFTNKGQTFLGEGKYVSVTDIAFEKEFVWFATDEFVTKDSPQFNIGGIYKFNRKAFWEKLDRPSGLPGNGISAIARTGNILWAGIYEFDSSSKEKHGRGLCLINRLTNKIEIIGNDELPLPSLFITAIYFDGTGIWIGTESGLLYVKLMNGISLFSPALQ